MNLSKNVGWALPLVATFLTVQPPNAEACGGCFVPPEENTVVTGHRMILSVGMTQSTLYDQIEYSGDPEEFAWVLPIVGTVDVGTSSDLIFNQLGFDTAVEVLPPVQDCPAIYCDGFDDFGSTGTGGLNGAPEDGGVEVLAEEVVGPYQTVQLAASDPNALNAWLDENGYNVPDDIQPVINAYVNDGFNFLAMKLIPGAGIDRMQPVRITSEGSNAVLPLRMVAAGTGATTTITLFIVGEGRYEPSNFPSFTIDPEHVVWSYDANESNYAALRQSAYDASQGFGWLVEAASPYSVDAFRNNVLNVVDFVPEQSGYAGDDPTDWEGIRQAAADDLDVLFGGLDPASVHVTRVRAELGRAALGTDLLVGAADDQSVVSHRIQTVAFEGTQPACPSPPPGCWYFDDEVDGENGNGSDKGGACTLTSPPAPEGTAFGGLLLAAVGTALVRRRRAIKRNNES